MNIAISQVTEKEGLPSAVTPGWPTTPKGANAEEVRTPLPLSASAQRGQEMEHARGEERGLRGTWVHHLLAL